LQPDLTIADALRQAVQFLKQEPVASPRLTAEVLLAHALGQERSYLYAHGADRLPELAWIHFGRWLHERSQGKPLQYIIRRQEFFGREFLVSPEVLIPRPETEHLVEGVMEIAAAGKLREGAMVDCGTGSGCLAVTLSLELRRRVYAVDVAWPETARENARRLGADVVFWQGDLLTALRDASLIVTNPPYIPEGDVLPPEVAQWEPRQALYSGPDGLSAWRRIIANAPPQSWLVGEIDSRADMRPLFGAEWSEVSVKPDLAGKPRVVTAFRGTARNPGA
jgi:release factor glutamine methyltransferase